MVLEKLHLPIHHNNQDAEYVIRPLSEMPTPRQVYVAVIGVGGVGKCFLNQFQALRTRMSQARSPTYLDLIFVSRSKKVLFSESFRPLNLD
ncbi:hypothetical protein KCU60_g13090, partial [Aureobasidium melanogenum]